MSQSTKACIRGCGIKNRHLAECDGTNPATDRPCRGCLPRRAEYGNLCWPCHRRLELMLTDAEIVDRWLSGNLARLGSQAPEDQAQLIHGTAWETPTPLRLEIVDCQQLLRDQYASWVDWLVERCKLTPTRADLKADAKRLLNWLDRIEEWDEIGDLWSELAETQANAHALAPWRPAMKRVGSIPCPTCSEVNLGIFGGQSDITCLSCGEIIPEQHFGLWERIVKEHAGIEVA